MAPPRFLTGSTRAAPTREGGVQRVPVAAMIHDAHHREPQIPPRPDHAGHGVPRFRPVHRPRPLGTGRLLPLDHDGQHTAFLRSAAVVVRRRLLRQQEEVRDVARADEAEVGDVEGGDLADASVLGHSDHECIGEAEALPAVQFGVLVQQFGDAPQFVVPDRARAGRPSGELPERARPTCRTLTSPPQAGYLRLHEHPFLARVLAFAWPSPPSDAARTQVKAWVVPGCSPSCPRVLATVDRRRTQPTQPTRPTRPTRPLEALINQRFGHPQEYVTAVSPLLAFQLIRPCWKSDARPSSTAYSAVTG